MALVNQYLEAAFGPGFTGLGTVGYALKDSAGSDVVARTPTGVFEQAGGTYGVVAPIIADTVATVEWDTGGGTPIYAHESIPRALDLEFIVGIEGGKQEITDLNDGTLICYAADNVTEIARFALYDSNGVRTTRLDRITRRDRL